MGFRKDIEQRFFPDVNFDTPSEIYFRLSRIALSDMFVEAHLPEKFPRTPGLCTEIREEVIGFLSAKMATGFAFADFTAGTDDKLSELAVHAQEVLDKPEQEQ